MIRQNWKLEKKINGQRPSFIYSWSIIHILEHKFPCLGRLGASSSNEKREYGPNYEPHYRTQGCVIRENNVDETSQGRLMIIYSLLQKEIKYNKEEI